MDGDIVSHQTGTVDMEVWHVQHEDLLRVISSVVDREAMCSIFMLFDETFMIIAIFVHDDIGPISYEGRYIYE